jgi:signal transduction histidine kinase
VISEPPFWRTRSFLGLLLVVASAVAVGLHHLRIARLKLRQRAVAEERTRIARDLHDGLSQKLRAIGLLSDQARADRSEGRAAAPLQQLQHIVHEAHAELRRAIWDMREGGGHQRLETAIERVLSEIEVPAEIKLTLETSGSSLPVSGLAAHEAPLVVKEAVINAVRHARAKHIEVGVLSDEEGLHVWVRDDGRGFSWSGSADGGTGYGIIGMHERARRLGGVLTTNSRADGGAEISLFVPRVAERGGRT